MKKTISLAPMMIVRRMSSLKDFHINYPSFLSSLNFLTQKFNSLCSISTIQLYSLYCNGDQIKQRFLFEYFGLLYGNQNL